MTGVEYFGLKAQRRVEYLTLALGLVGAVTVLALRGWPEAAGLALGATVGWLNFRWLKRFVHWVARISMALPGGGKPRPVRVAGSGPLCYAVSLLLAGCGLSLRFTCSGRSGSPGSNQ
jgi:hypothetical protein